MPAINNITVKLMAPVPTLVLTSNVGDYQNDPGVVHIGIGPPAVASNGGPSAAAIALYTINATAVAGGAPVVFTHVKFIGQSDVTQTYRFSIEG